MMHKKSLGQKIHLGVLAAMILVFGAVTAWNHMHEGFRFHDGLLRVSEPEDGVFVYSGEVKGAFVTATVTHPTNFRSVVDISIGDWLHDVCEVEYPLDEMTTDLYVYKVYGIRITKNGIPFFEGGLSQEFSSVWMWFDQNGKLTNGSAAVYTGGQSDWKNYETSPSLIARLALNPKLVSRGDFELYAVCVVSALLLMAAVAYPDAVFLLKYRRFVKDPEPTEYYTRSMVAITALLTAVLFAAFCYASACLPN
ncbi:MAG: hypothetical protein HFF87_04415 [Oscillibacter sp.]|jgi:hypothetical protein|nr:hypothetical protein [Oscillibacter sp.]